MTDQQSLNQYDEVLDVLNDSFASIENQVMNAITDGNVELIKSFKPSLVKIIRKFNEEAFRIRHEASLEVDSKLRNQLLIKSNVFQRIANLPIMLNLIISSPNGIEEEDFTDFFLSDVNLTKYIHIWKIAKRKFDQAATGDLLDND